MSKVKDFIIIASGVFMVAAGVYFFMIPNDIAGGGINGLAIVINNYIPSIPVGIIMMGIDIILFIAAFIVIGPSFGTKTIFSSLLLSGTVALLEFIVPLDGPLTDDLLIQVIFGIALQAVGMAVIFNRDASTGGTDIIAKILNKYFHINMGRGVLIADIFVVALAFNAFGFKKGLYALFVVIATGLSIDKAIEGFNVFKQVKIVSSKMAEIQDFIMHDLRRGCTIYHATGSFNKKPIDVLWTVIDSREFIRLKNFIKNIDSKAFVSVSDISEVIGEGFRNIE